jgi:hypothetical protein
MLTVTAAVGINVWELVNSDFTNTGGTFSKDPTKTKRGTANLLLGASFTPSAIPLTVNFAGAINGMGSPTVKKANEDERDDPDYKYEEGYKDGAYNPYWVFIPKLNAEFGVNDALAVGLTIEDLYFADGYYHATTDPDEDAKDRGLGLLFPITFHPYVTYAINDDITLGADLKLLINTNGSDVFGFGIKPSAEFSLGSGAKFVVYDELTFYGTSQGLDKGQIDLDTDLAKKYSAAAGAAVGLADTTTNTLQFDFVWTF